MFRCSSSFSFLCVLFLSFGYSRSHARTSYPSCVTAKPRLSAARLHFLEQNVETLKVSLPKAAVALCPFSYLADCVWIQSAKIFAAVALPFDEARVFQIGEVFGDGLLRNRERRGKLVNGRGPTGKSIDDQSAGRI